MAGDPVRDRVFRALLRLFPAEFRGDFGDQMMADFDGQRRDAAGRPRDVRRLWMRTVLDLPWRAACEHADALWRDAAYAVRALRRHPAFTATAVLSLAIGIGLNSAVYSVVSGVLWRDLPFPDSDRLVQIGAVTPSNSMPAGLPAAVYEDLQQRTGTLEAVTASVFRGVTIVAPGEPMTVGCPGITANFLDVLGTRPMLGRHFAPHEYAQALSDLARSQETPAPRVMMLSHSLWQRRFASDTAVVGRRVTLRGGSRAEIVGVLGPEVESLAGPLTTAGCWTPQPEPTVSVLPRGWRASSGSSSGSFVALGRLRPGVSIEDVQVELNVLGADLGRPFSDEPQALHILTLRERIVAGVRPQLTLLFGAVVCVLLVTCANIASLSLARAAGTRDELATRIALGAARARLVRQTLTESLVLSAAGGLCGLLLAVWAVPALIASAPPGIPRLQGIGVSWSTFAFAVLVSAAVGLCCGLLVSLSAHRRADPVSQSVGARATVRASRLRQGLVVSEIALALMLVVGATLMVRSVRALGAIDLGFDPTQVIAAELPSAPGPFDQARTQQLHGAAIERVKALPGVVAAGVGLGPLNGGMGIGGLTVPGDPRDFGTVRVDAVSPGFFEALGVRLIAGRFFEPRDVVRDGAAVVLVNETAARTFWSGADPIGRSVITGKSDEQVVIGVISDLREAGLEAEPGPTMYQLSNRSPNFVAGSMLIKVDGDPDALVPAIRAIVRSIDPEAPFSGVTPLQERIDRETAPRRFVLQVIGLFSIVGLILAVVGVYGVLAEFVAQRVPEIGVRMACGATALDVVRLVFRHGWRLAMIGIGIGLAGAVLARGTMSQMVYGVPTLDPLTYVTAVLCLLTATIAACAIPATRASRLDPVVALRLE